MSDFLERYSPFLRQYWLPLALGVSGLILLIIGITGYLGQNKEKGEITYEAASTSKLDEETVGVNNGKSESGKSLKDRQITVDVEGAVEKPGVYKLSAEGRMQDAVIAAGGLGKDADRALVAKNINLATKLIDGAKVYIPFEGEEVQKGESVVLGETTKLININTASEGELDTLAGIGKVTIEKIVSNRPYGSIDELKEKKVVGEKVFEQIKEKITVN